MPPESSGSPRPSTTGDNMNLRTYQQDANRQVRDYEGSCILYPARAVVQSPTGSGKTRMIADLLTDDFPQVLYTHRRVLLDQLSRVLTSLGVDHGIRAAGFAPNPVARVQLCMIQSDFARTIKRLDWGTVVGCRRILIDEAHACKSSQVQQLIAKYPDASVIGWTATPREIGHIYKKLIVAATVPELIRQGHLVPPVVYCPDFPDMDKLDRVKRQSSGEYSTSDIGKLLRPQYILGRVLQNWRQLNPDENPTVLFAPGVPHSRWFAEKFNSKGIKSAHIDGKEIVVDGQAYSSTPTAREELFARFEAGEIKVLTTRFVLREGVDLTSIAHVIVATSFGTRTSWVQACGRAMRPHPGKTECIIQDHGGNALRLPPLDSDDPWDMTSKESDLSRKRLEEMREGTEPEPIVCPQCSHIRKSGPECPQCHFRHNRSTRLVVQVNGRLVRQDGKVYKKRRVVGATNEEARSWASSFWAARKGNPTRTMRQVYTFAAKQRGWKWHDKTLPLMPKEGADHVWSQRVGQIDMNDLRKGDT